jgi:SAM-dependent methyltransferase
MIVDLLKQVFPALGRFFMYHTRRVFRRNEKPVVAPASMATRESIDALSNEAALDPAYETLVQWPTYRKDVPSKEIVADSFYQLWKTIPNGHKWTHYFAAYQEVFGPRRDDPMRILEIGVLSGSSLRLWKRYFRNPKTMIVGIDISPECIKFDSPAEGIRVKIGSQADAGFLKSIVEEFGPFDLIIDDGSHHSSHMIASFNCLYGDGLKDTGIYFVEDLHANYWHPWRDSKRSFLDLCKELLEHMHGHYQRASPGAFMINKPSDQPATPLQVPRITTMIREIRFFDSMVAIYKTRREYVPYYLRVGD